MRFYLQNIDLVSCLARFPFRNVFPVTKSWSILLFFFYNHFRTSSIILGYLVLGSCVLSYVIEFLLHICICRLTLIFQGHLLKIIYALHCVFSNHCQKFQYLEQCSFFFLFFSSVALTYISIFIFYYYWYI